MAHWINPKRVRDYPRLILLVMIFMLSINVIFRKGWIGLFGKIIGCDFIMLYSSGILFSTNSQSLYDFQVQGQVQKALLNPTPLWGILPYNYPPYVAFILNPLTKIPLVWAFIFWTLLTLLLVGISVHWIYQYLLPQQLKSKWFSKLQMLIVTFSFFPFIEGLQVGQNHGLTLFLTTGIILFSLKERWFLAGIFAGLSIYKPQFALGFIILWLVWGKYKAIAGYSIVAGIWAGSLILVKGFEPYLAYIKNIPLLLNMMNMSGFGGYLEVTPYGLLVSTLPESAWSGIVLFTNLLGFLMVIGLAWYGLLQRRKPVPERIPAMMMATLFPLMIAPHTLLHDLLILIPVFVLWSRFWNSRRLLYIVIIVYFSTLLLPLVTYRLDIAFLSLIPIALSGLIIYQAIVLKPSLELSDT